MEAVFLSNLTLNSFPTSFPWHAVENSVSSVSTRADERTFARMDSPLHVFGRGAPVAEI